MKAFKFSVTALFMLIVMYSCYKGQNTDKTSVQENQTASSVVLSKEIGALLPVETTNSWAASYNAMFKESGNLYYYLKVSDLKNILAQPDCAGIVFYYAYGPDWMVIPAGIKADGTIIHQDSIPVQNGYVSFAQAKEWITAYNPAGKAVTAHFFGSDPLARLLNMDANAQIRFRMGWDGNRGLQLLLSNVSYNSVELDRSGHYSYNTEPVYQ